MAYATDEEVKEWVGVDDLEDDPRFAFVTPGAKAGIDRWCGRNFDKETVASARYFRPLSCTTVMIDDCYEITSVATDLAEDGAWSTAWATTDWFATPVGGVGPSMSTGWPYTAIVACEAREFTRTVRPFVKVTAKWGWTAVPADVKLAYLLYSAELFKLHEAPLGTSWTENGNDPIIRNNRPLRDLLQPFKRENASDGRFMVA